MKDKRTIISKGDGRNFLGIAPDGTIHNMRKSFGGSYYRIKWNKDHGVIPVGDPLTKAQFILEK